MAPLRRLTLAAALIALATAATGPVGTASPREEIVVHHHARLFELVESVPVESVLGNPDLRSAHDVWVEMIRGAKHSLDLEEFYLSTWPGEPLEDVLREIRAAAARGVRVRLLLDAGMHKTYPQPADSLGLLPGVSVRIIDMKPHGGGIQHAKYFLVDGRDVFLGSQNTDWRALKHIHELGVRVIDPRVAAVFAESFAMDWAAAGGEPIPASAHAPGTLPLPFVIVQAPGDTLRLWPSYNPRGFLPDSTLWDLDALVRMIDSARHELVAQTLTYGTGAHGRPDHTLDQALRRAAARGVKVSLIVSDWEKGSAEMASLQALDSIPGIEIKLSTVPEWSGGYIPFARVEHCKYAVADDERVWVGTSNWEPGYFFGSRNVALTLENPRLAAAAHAVFSRSWSSPTAEPLHPGVYPAKIRGETPPPGARRYGG